MLEVFKIKKVPKLFWSSDEVFTLRPKSICVVMLMLGLILFGLGEACLVASGIGSSPWTVLADGVATLMGWGIGFATFVISSFVLLLWYPLRQVPGIGTILNILIIAFVIEISHPKLPQFENEVLQILEAFFGVIITGIGGGIYLIANLGPGPRDGLMTGCQKATNLPIAWVRVFLEITVISIGWMLGGTIGIATVIFAFGIGPAVSFGLYLIASISKN